jgi:type II secretory pathway pseudopilin PulG
MRKYYVFITLLCLLSIGLVAAAIVLTGTPATQRARQLDETRLADFSGLAAAINSYHAAHDELPQTLEELKEETEYISTEDPETKTGYAYKITSDDAYELCATFSTDSKDNPGNTARDSSYPYPYSSSRDHKKGYDCIKYTIPEGNGDIFKPIPMPEVKATPETLTN